MKLIKLSLMTILSLLNLNIYSAAKIVTADENLPLVANEPRDFEFIKAAKYGNLDEIKKYIDSGVNVNVAFPGLKYTALMEAARNNNKIIPYLIEAGANVNAVDSEGRTPLVIAVEHRNNDAIPLLLNKANINVTDNNDRTPLIIATISNNEAAIPILIKANAHINHKDKSGRTALMWAVEEINNKNIVEMLLEAGADIGIKNIDGKTAIDFASRKWGLRYPEDYKVREEILKLLQSTAKKREEALKRRQKAIKDITNTYVPPVLSDVITEYLGETYKDIPENEQ